MAEGYINVEHTERKTVTLAEGFSLESWGYVQAIKLGHLLFVNGSGLKSSTAITTLTVLGTIADITLTDSTAGIVNLSGTGVIGLQLWSGGTNKIRVSAGLPANKLFDFFVVGFCN